jgi:hypothetical protein
LPSSCSTGSITATSPVGSCPCDRCAYRPAAFWAPTRAIRCSGLGTRSQGARRRCSRRTPDSALGATAAANQCYPLRSASRSTAQRLPPGDPGHLVSFEDRSDQNGLEGTCIGRWATAKQHPGPRGCAIEAVVCSHLTPSEAVLEAIKPEPMLASRTKGTAKAASHRPFEAWPLASLMRHFPYQINQEYARELTNLGSSDGHAQAPVAAPRPRPGDLGHRRYLSGLDTSRSRCRYRPQQHFGVLDRCTRGPGCCTWESSP